MIVFIPAYDSATRINLEVARPILPINVVPLLEQNAVRSQLWLHLSNQDNLFIMSHGNSDKIWDNDKAMAIDLADLPQFSRKNAFVYACFTANELGKKLKTNNNIYWGYTGSISAPNDQPNIINSFSSIFDYILKQFPECNTATTIKEFINTLKILCDEKESTMDVLYEKGIDVDMSCYTCLLHIWSRLRVYHFDEFEHFKHKDAREGDLFEL